MRVSGYDFSLTREPLVRPFSFKGGSFTEKWITVTSLGSDGGLRATGIGGLAVLWSDNRIFAEHSEVGGNLLMSAVAERAAQCVQGAELSAETSTPIEIQQEILPEIMDYARRISGRNDTRKTFVLNSLVSLDLALWKLYAALNNFTNFDDVVPASYREVLSARHEHLAHVPLITYGIDAKDVSRMAEQGTRIFKIKLGQAGSQSEMLEKDKERLTRIHEALGGGAGRPLGGGAGRPRADGSEAEAPPGEPLYYLDANGRYKNKENLQKLISHLEAIGALSQVLLLEEPFPAGEFVDVRDLPVTIAADESVEGPEDVRRLVDEGYGAFAIKPAGKTLSASLRAAEVAVERGVPCFVADSACVPLLVEWNKNVAARLPAPLGLDYGMLESNGADHYLRWKEMLDAHPCSGRRWIEPVKGFYRLDRNFYDHSACIFGSCGRYEELLSDRPL